MIIWFRGNKLRGIDLIGEMEEISIKQQMRRIERKCGVPKGHYVESKECRKHKIYLPNTHACEGERGDYIYYLRKDAINRVKRNTLKAILIQIFGYNIDK